MEDRKVKYMLRAAWGIFSAWATGIVGLAIRVVIVDIEAGSLKEEAYASSRTTLQRLLTASRAIY